MFSVFALRPILPVIIGQKTRPDIWVIDLTSKVTCWPETWWALALRKMIIFEFQYVRGCPGSTNFKASCRDHRQTASSEAPVGAMVKTTFFCFELSSPLEYGFHIDRLFSIGPCCCEKITFYIIIIYVGCCPVQRLKCFDVFLWLEQVCKYQPRLLY